MAQEIHIMYVQPTNSTLLSSGHKKIKGVVKEVEVQRGKSKVYLMKCPVKFRISSFLFIYQVMVQLRKSQLTYSVPPHGNHACIMK